MKRIGIIGGGASGAITAARLLEKSGPEIQIDLIDPSGDPGPGVPYRTGNPDHLLNVVAARMSAIDEDPDHFLRWIRTRDSSVEPGDYIRRGVYGEYLRGLLQKSDELRPAETQSLRVIQGEVVAIERSNGSLVLEMKGSPPIRCDEVVLAVGAIAAPDPVSVSAEIEASGKYISDVWADEWLGAASDDDRVLILGTGLTMVDAALSLSRSRTGPQIYAMSRNGLFPKAHRKGFVRLEPPTVDEEGSIGLKQALSMFFELEARSPEEGGDWRDAMDAMRRVTPSIWRRMPVADKRRFLDEFARTWEVHRFRMAPEVAERFDSLREADRLEILKGTILRLETVPGGLQASIEADGEIRTLRVDRVINCTGAGREITGESSPLLSSMIAKGLIKEDVLRMGLEVTPDGRAVEGSGAVSADISVVGPLRRGVEWEAIGITEIRVQAAGVAERLSAEAATGEIGHQPA